MSRGDPKRNGSGKGLEPTPRETDILQVLWEQGPSSVRDVHRELSARSGTENILRTTVLKHMQIMLDKGLVVRDDTASPQRYQAASARPHVERQMVDGFKRRVFDGSASKLILRALDTDEITSNELDEIRQLLDQLDGQLQRDET